jgi:N-acetylated-alpha-linked acidic dipeptidase
MIQSRHLLLAAAAALIAVPAGAQSPSADQRAREGAFDTSIRADEQLTWLKQLASAPTHAGSPHAKANAETVLALFKGWGWDAKIERFDVLYPTPVSTALEMITPQRVTLGGQEPAIAGDPDTARTDGLLPPYVAYQGDGDVTAPLVYVNYGMPADYEELARRGIDVKGKIVIARYGGGWRGLKPKLAQEHGALGTVIFSDPADDGYGVADIYPRGGGRPEGGVQRGSVLDMITYPGDPLTPGVGSVPGAKRLAREEAVTILKIPVLPISYGDATKLMAGLEGPLVPREARGGLPLAYHYGGTDAVKVRLAVKSNWSQTPVYNVIAKLPGATRPDEWIVRGNHRDGWGFGAADPLSGHVAMLSEAKALGELVKKGWRPDRTIVYASWDGEEAGLLGSTEWVETHADELKRKAVLYINTDSNSRGVLSAGGSHELQRFVSAVAADVTDPQTGVSIIERANAVTLARNYARPGSVPAVNLAAARAGGDLPLSALGSGSDYSAFLEHIGIATLNIGFGGEGQSAGSYHSIYDTVQHFTQFDDPGLAYGVALSKTVGRLVMRAASGERLPARYSDLATVLARYVAEVKALAVTQREGDRALAQLTRDGVFKIASDPRDPTAAPVNPGITQMIDMLALEDAADRLRRSAAAADSALARFDSLDAARRGRIAATLNTISQQLLHPDGLPFRPWYKNLAYAPGLFTGYGAKTLPGVREAVEERRHDDARNYVAKTAQVLNAYADRLDAATAIARAK